MQVAQNESINIFQTSNSMAIFVCKENLQKTVGSLLGIVGVNVGELTSTNGPTFHDPRNSWGPL